MDTLPHLFFDSVLRNQKKHTIAYYNRHNDDDIRGSYGILHKYIRKDLSGEIQQIIVKRPKFAHTRPEVFHHEALLQRHVHGTLEKQGHGGAVPRVCDIFIENDQVCFSMEFIRGTDCLSFCRQQPGVAFDIVWLQIMFQLALLLATLQNTICFDHRDLKYNNVWIRKRAVAFSMLGWKCQFPFEVVLLDFGFACLGDKNRRAVVNLGEGVFEDTDKCPKEGRDMFQFILSFWSQKVFRDSCSPLLREWIERLLVPKYSNITKMLNSFDWSYLVTRDAGFSLPQLEPLTVLEKIYEHFPFVIS
jgi:serine/threonine protein kinase